MFEDFGELGQRVLAGHHRAEDSPVLEARAGPQRAPLDHGQHPGIDQRGLAGAAVAFDLQPAVVAGAATAVHSFRIGLSLVTQTGDRFERLLAPSEEQPVIPATEGIQAKEGAALEGRRFIEPDGAILNGFEQRAGQGLGGRPAGGLEQGEKRWQGLRSCILRQQNGKDRQAFLSLWGDKCRVSAISTSAPTQRCTPSRPTSTTKAEHACRASCRRVTQRSPTRIASSSWKTLSPACSSADRRAMHASRSVRL